MNHRLLCLIPTMAIAAGLYGCGPIISPPSCSPNLDVQRYAECGLFGPGECDYPDGTKCLCSVLATVYQCLGPEPDAAPADLALADAPDANVLEDAGALDGGSD